MLTGTRSISLGKGITQCYCLLDVNLIDVLEMIVDCVMSGKGRSGHETPQYLKLRDPTVLERAYWNTVKLLDDEVVIEREE